MNAARSFALGNRNFSDRRPGVFANYVAGREGLFRRGGRHREESRPWSTAFPGDHDYASDPLFLSRGF
jgi:hypothetical protein